MNKLFDNNISLERESHTYNLASNPNLEFTSATTFVGQFFEEFNPLKVATRLVAKSPKYRGMTVEELLQVWRDSAEHGTIVHEEIENNILNQSPLSERKAIHGINWLNKFKLTSRFEMYPEVIVYSEELQLCGTIDLLVYDKEKDIYNLMDWKTSKSISTKSYGNKKGIKPATADLDDTKFNLYSLQLSLYRYLLEEYYGLKIGQHMILHLKEEECIGVHTPYLKNNVLKMVETRLK